MEKNTEAQEATERRGNKDDEPPSTLARLLPARGSQTVTPRKKEPSHETEEPSDPPVPESREAEELPTFQPRPIPPPGPEERLVEALRSELTALQQRNEQILSRLNLDRIRVDDHPSEVPVDCGPSGTVLYARHALVKKALTTFEEDPLLLSFLASATYTALNIWLEEVTDHHERVFHGLLADHVLSHVAAREDAT